MVVALINDTTGKQSVIRSGWDVENSNKPSSFYENYARVYEETFINECLKFDLDPDYCECTIEIISSGIGDPILEAKKLVHKTMRRLRLTS